MADMARELQRDAEGSRALEVGAPRTGTPEEALQGEYASPRLRLPGWGAASLLMAAPGAVLPWLLPALIRRGTEWSTLRPALLVVPVAALAGLVFGVLGVRRSEGSASALVGLALNVVLLLLVAAVVVILVF